MLILNALPILGDKRPSVLLLKPPAQLLAARGGFVRLKKYLRLDEKFSYVKSDCRNYGTVFSFPASERFGGDCLRLSGGKNAVASANGVHVVFHSRCSAVPLGRRGKHRNRFDHSRTDFGAVDMPYAVPSVGFTKNGRGLQKLRLKRVNAEEIRRVYASFAMEGHFSVMRSQ